MAHFVHGRGSIRLQAQVLDLAEAATLLRVSPEVVRGLAESHRIPARRVGDLWRFGHGALLEWLKGDPAAASGSAPAGPASDSGRTEMQSSELADVTAKGLRPSPPAPPAQPPPAAKPQTDSTTSTVGERPSTPTSQEVALRDQRVLLARGAPPSTSARLMDEASSRCSRSFEPRRMTSA